MANISTVGRSLVILVALVLFVQMVMVLKSSIDPHVDENTPDAYTRQRPKNNNNNNDGQEHVYKARDPTRNRHPTVPLSLQDLEELDVLSDRIAVQEAYRVFENKEVGRLRGTTIRNQPELVQRIRNQIQCWTTRGRWQRRGKGGKTPAVFEPLKHMGDPRFARCDKNFVRALDREGSGHFMGEWDPTTRQLMVREAVKYEWVPDETACGPDAVVQEQPLPEGQQQQQQQQQPAPGTFTSPEEPPLITRNGLQNEAATYKHATRPQFCEVLAKRDILVVGDLTQYQLHDVIASSFRSSFVCYGELGCLHHSPHGLCSNSALKYARNDLISVPWAVDPADDEFPSASAVEQAWATADLLQRYKILVLNRGLIWRPDEVFLQELVFTMKYLWKNYPDVLILYRATHPVSNCTTHKLQGEDEVILDKDGRPILPGTVLQRPLVSPPSRSAAMEGGADHHNNDDDDDDGRPVFRPTLADVQRQNRIAKRVVEAAGGLYLDTETMFALRPDGRMGEGDCARFCAPGPLDAYADLLFNTLRILRHAEGKAGGAGAAAKKG
ncbi:hypothetical protein DFQ26_004914 [Actinomortierella ambigua]|nr:hypothetical protein DFQ26_004914 [Actinomortierella ambigua]